MLPYLPVPIQRIALGEMYGGAHRVADRCLQEIVDGLRNPGTLRHVLCIIRCWFGEMVKLKTSLRRVKWIPMLLVWGDCDRTISLDSGIKLNRKLRASKLVVVPGGSHSVFEDMPEQSNRIMLEWLGRHSLSTPRPRNMPRPASLTEDPGAPPLHVICFPRPEDRQRRELPASQRRVSTITMPGAVSSFDATASPGAVTTVKVPSAKKALRSTSTL
jgi:hypothetical protein